MKRIISKIGVGRLILYTFVACIGCSGLAYAIDSLTGTSLPEPVLVEKIIEVSVTPAKAIIYITPTTPPTETALPTRTSANTPTPTTAPTETAPPTPTPANTLTPTTTHYAPNADCVPTDTEVTYATVIGITDGDTISVQFEDGTQKSVRYIGMDTPERGDTFSEGATNKNSELVAGKLVTLIKDVSETDQYDRLLRYVLIENSFVNYELVRQGFASAGSWPPDTSCDRTLHAAEEAAREDAVGIWASPMVEPTPVSSGDETSGNIMITYIFYNGIAGDKEPDEYVEIRNDGSGSINLQGWSLVDEADHIFRFPDYSIAPGEVCRIYTNEVHEEWCGFNYGFTGSAIWNNSGDCAYLRDESSTLVDDYCY